MVFFRKNKRQFGISSHRRLFAALFLFLVFGVSAIVSLLLNANAQLVPVASVEISSEHTNFENGEAGAWKVTKSAEWTALGKARVTFEVESIMKYDDSKKLDVVMVIDNSGSMGGDKIAQVKTDATDLANTLLSDSDNRIALITFNTSAEILTEFSNNKQELISLINSIDTPGCTNYYQGLLKAEEVLEDYERNDGRELVLLFLTDGYPNEETPNEIAQYQLLKKKYPYMTINGIQYEMGDAVLQPIINVSDNQFIASRRTLNNVLFEATIIPYIYDDFAVTDYINDDYWTIAGLEAIDASLGEIGLEYDGATPKVVWDMNGVYHSGGIATLTIDIDLKQEFINVEDLLLPTNKSERVETELWGVPDERVDYSGTPVLKDAYDVIYDANLPEGCEAQNNVPDRMSYSIFSQVAISDVVLSCPNYSFKGWKIETPRVRYINDDYFLMPGNDVLLAATWGKIGITKSMDGTMHTRGTATFAVGADFNAKIKILSGQTDVNYGTLNTTITRIAKADSLSTMVDINDDAYIVSSPTSQMPIYAWYDNGTIYYYSDADEIYINPTSTYMFQTLKGLTNIDGLSFIDTSRLDNATYMFNGSGITNVDALSTWDMGNATNLSGMFQGTPNLANIDGLADWDVSHVRTMSHMFSGADSLVDIDALIDWDTSNVTDMSYMFLYSDNFADVSGAVNWNTSKVTSIRGMFWEVKIKNVDALATKVVDGVTRWDVSHVTDLSYLFIYSSELEDISGISNWDVSNVTLLQGTFSGIKASNVDALSNWDVSNVTNMSSTFSGSKIADLSGIANWNTSKVTDMSGMFSAIESPNVDALATKVVDGVTRWDVSNVKNMSNMFYRSYDSRLTNIDGLSNWDTSSVTDMNEMFFTAKISSLDALATKVVDGVTRWDVSHVTDTSYMFFKNSNITDISALSNWDMSSNKNMKGMFYNVQMTNVDALSNWNTSEVTDMDSVFSNATKLENINGIRNWNTTKVTTMYGMFYAAKKITNVDALATKVVDGVTRWDVSNVKNMSNMFYGALTLQDISGLGAWNTNSVTNMSLMFYNNVAITDLSPLYNWNVSNVTNMSNMFYSVPESITRPTWYVP